MPALLENYVEELRIELQGLPVTQRAEQLLEVRTHLDSLKSANLELGLTEEEAEAAAISQLGGSKTLGKQTRRATWRDQWDTIPGVAFTFGFISWFPNVFLIDSASRSVESIPNIFIFIYFVIGAFLKNLFPKYAIKGIIFAICTILISEILFYSLRKENWNFIFVFHGPQVITFLGAVVASKCYMAQEKRRVA
jgi:hypothetical protein